MAHCDEYQNMSLQERVVLLGTICHLVQNDSDSFIAVSSMIRSASQQGKLDAVTILPERQQDNHE